MLRLIGFLLSVSFTISCQNCICEHSSGLRLGMVSFDSTEIDTMIVRKFQKGNDFTNLIDTMQWDRATVVFYAQSDTLTGDALLQPGFDYQVFMPTLNRTFKISEINEPRIEGNCNGKVMCVDKIVSCKLDGSITQTGINDDILYLKK